MWPTPTSEPAADLAVAFAIRESGSDHPGVGPAGHIGLIRIRSEVEEGGECLETAHSRSESSRCASHCRWRLSTTPCSGFFAGEQMQCSSALMQSMLMWMNRA